MSAMLLVPIPQTGTIPLASPIDALRCNTPTADKPGPAIRQAQSRTTAPQFRQPDTFCNIAAPLTDKQPRKRGGIIAAVTACDLSIPLGQIKTPEIRIPKPGEPATPHGKRLNTDHFITQGTTPPICRSKNPNGISARFRGCREKNFGNVATVQLIPLRAPGR